LESSQCVLLSLYNIFNRPHTTEQVITKIADGQAVQAVLLLMVPGQIIPVKRKNALQPVLLLTVWIGPVKF